MTKTKETIETVMNEGTVDAVKQAVEAIPVESNGKYTALGVGTVAVIAATIIGGVVAGVCYFKRKKQQKETQNEAAGVIDAQATADDFEENNSEEA